MKEPKLSKTIVLHSCRTWLPQTQIWLYNQVRYLPSDIENHIIAITKENIERFPIHNIHFLKQESRWKSLSNSSLGKLIVSKIKVTKLKQLSVEIVAQKKVRVLHSHFGNRGWKNSELSIAANIKHIVSFYGYDINYLPNTNPVWYQRYKKLFKKVDLILCEGSHMAQSIEKLGCPKDKIKVHHLGISTDKIEFKPRKWNRQTPLRILIAASFVEKKGIPYALEALGQLQHEVDLEITIIGDARKLQRTQVEKQKILATIDKYGLKSKVRLLGYQPHDVLLKEAYQHHIFISPSITASDGDTEGGAPVSIIDMAATGMPIVSTTHCDIPEVIINGVTGLLVEERDVVGLKKSLNYLIDHPELWHKMTNLGRQHIEREYDVQIQGRRLAEIYKQVAN